MSARFKRAALPLAAATAAMLALSPAIAAAPQGGRDPNVGTETQERLAEGQRNDFDWGWLGLLGLFGLAGLRNREVDYSHAI